MFVAYIKCKDRVQKRKIILGSKRGSFKWDGDEYDIIPKRCYRTRIWLIKEVFASDYVKGIRYPVNFWGVGEDGKADVTPSYGVDKVVELIKRFIVGIPHFELIVVLMLGVNMFLSIATLYLLNKAGLV